MPGTYHAHRSPPRHSHRHHHSHRSHTHRGTKDPPGHHESPPMTSSGGHDRGTIAVPTRVHPHKASSARPTKSSGHPHSERTHFPRPTSAIVATSSNAHYSAARARADLDRMTSLVPSASSTATPPTSPDDTSASSGGGDASASASDISWVAFRDDGHDVAAIIIGDGGENSQGRRPNNNKTNNIGGSGTTVTRQNRQTGPPRHSSSTTFGVPSTTNNNFRPKPSPPSVNNQKSSKNKSTSNGRDEQGDVETGLATTSSTSIKSNGSRGGGGGSSGAGGNGAPNNNNYSNIPNKRRCLLLTLAVVVLVVAIGVTCGIVLGGGGGDADNGGGGGSNANTALNNAAASNNKAGETEVEASSSVSTSASSSASSGTGGGAGGSIDADEQEELFSTMILQDENGDGGGGGGGSNEEEGQGDILGDAVSTLVDIRAEDNNGVGTSPKDDMEGSIPNEGTDAATSPTNSIDVQQQQQPQQESLCTDDAAWLVVVGDRYGKSVFIPYGCDWVATDPPENCNTVGATPSVSNINRIADVATSAWIACPSACGSCGGGEGGGQDPSPLGSPAEDIALTVGTVFESPPTSSKPTPAPTRRPTAKPTPAPVPRPVPSPTTTTHNHNQNHDDADTAITCQSTAIDTNADDIALPFLPGVAVGSVDAVTLGEASGLVASTGGLNPGILWTHNDAPKFPNRPNNRNRIYAIDAENHGNVVAAYSIEGAKNIDWEDIAYGNGPEGGGKFIYLGDIGDNDEVRREIYIYRVKEPDISSDASPFLTEWDRLTLTYPDRRSRNVEAFLFDPVDEIFYLMTKTGGYIFSTPAKWGRGSTSMTLRQAGLMSEFRKQPLVGADISPDGKEILLKYYGSVKYFCRESESESVAEVFQTHDSLKLSYDREKEPKGEAVAWAKEGFYTLSEQDGYSTTPLYFYKRSGH